MRTTSFCNIFHLLLSYQRGRSKIESVLIFKTKIFTNSDRFAKQQVCFLNFDVNISKNTEEISKKGRNVFQKLETVPNTVLTHNFPKIYI